MSVPAFPVETLGMPTINYSLAKQDVTKRIDTRDGLPNVVRLSTSGYTEISVEWSWSAAHYAEFQAWYRDDCKDGTIPFTIANIYNNADLSTITARLKEQYSAVYQTWEHYKVSATLEVPEHDYITEAALDLALPTNPHADAPTWPSELFGNPTDDWALDPQSSALKGNVGGYALSSMKRKSPISIIRASLGAEMSNANRILFEAWWHYKLVDGTKWFWLNCPFNGVWQYVKVRFIEPPKITYEPVDWWKASGDIETVEYNYLPLADCDDMLPPSEAPYFVKQPTDQIADADELITFAPTITGEFPMTYQWYADDAAIVGEIGINYSTTITTENYDTAYKLTVANSYGEITSNTAYSRLTPTFTTQPLWNGVIVGQTATATVVVVGSGTKAIQWYKGETSLTGKTSSTLTITNVQEEDSGEYHCVATSEYGATQSITAWLYVNIYFTITENQTLGFTPYFLEAETGVATTLETELANLGFTPYFVDDETGVIMSPSTEPMNLAFTPYFYEETSA